MPSSPVEPGTTGGSAPIESLVALYEAALQAFADGDAPATLRHLDATPPLLAAATADRGVPGARAAHVVDLHAKLLAAVTGERERTRAELARVRSGRRALRSYGGRRTPGTASRPM